MRPISQRFSRELYNNLKPSLPCPFAGKTPTRVALIVGKERAPGGVLWRYIGKPAPNLIQKINKHWKPGTVAFAWEFDRKGLLWQIVVLYHGVEFQMLAPALVTDLYRFYHAQEGRPNTVPWATPEPIKTVSVKVSGKIFRVYADTPSSALSRKAISCYHKIRYATANT